MMVVMTPDASASKIEAVVERLEGAGVHAKAMPGTRTTAIGAIGDPEGVRESNALAASSPEVALRCSVPFP
jgi:3-deoxy-7-phosphoheptulonate synthase